MSLINDALRRGGGGQRPPPLTPTEGLQSVSPGPERRSLLPLILVPLLVVLVLGFLGLAGWMLLGREKTPRVVRAPETAAPVSREALTPTAPPSAPKAASPVVAPSSAKPAVREGSRFANPKTPVASSTITGAPAAPLNPIQRTEASLETVAKLNAEAGAQPERPVAPAPTPVRVEPPPASVPEDAVTFPVLKLQGIFYRGVRSSALINRKEVGVGEVVDGVKVISITRESVVVELQGQRKSLNLK